VEEKFEPKREEGIGKWSKLHNKELHNFCSSQNINKDIKSRSVIGVTC